jgi:nitric oxide reductase subunit B
MVWSVLSFIALLGGTGLLLAAFGRWNFLGWHGREDQRVSFRPPNQVALTPSQRSCAWFFLIMAAMLLMQTLLGGATQHYRSAKESRRLSQLRIHLLSRTRLL